MSDGESFSDLRRRTEANLVDFLHTEIELGWTMLRVRASTRSAEHKRRIVANIKKAIETVRYFEKRVATVDVRKKLHRDVGHLELALRRSSAPRRPSAAKT